jgi:hypothetical protein
MGNHIMNGGKEVDGEHKSVTKLLVKHVRNKGIVGTGPK